MVEPLKVHETYLESHSASSTVVSSLIENPSVHHCGITGVADLSLNSRSSEPSESTNFRNASFDPAVD